jgi:hypothetical protein
MMKKVVLTVVIFFLFLSACGCGALFRDVCTIGSILPEQKEKD